MTYHMWPQILVAMVFIAITVMGFIRNGQPLNNPTTNATQIFWTSMWFALVLGAGGFWDLR